MDKFPEDLTRANCVLKMNINQQVFLKNTRKEFNDLIDQAVEVCDQELTLVFPKKLWMENRLIIASELLERFGELRLTNVQKNITVNKVTDDVTKLPKNLQSVTIEFIPK